MEFKGTKGKWYINRCGNIVTENEAVAYIPSLTKEEHKEANTLLISKAPEMLEMLKKAKNTLKDVFNCDVSEIENIIKEATEL